MRLALFTIAAVAGAALVWLAFAWLSPDEARQEAALPVYLGGDEGSDDEVDADAFGPGPSVCSMDPRYRPKPGADQTCPVVQ